jgi:hypothetical protein
MGFAHAYNFSLAEAQSDVSTSFLLGTACTSLRGVLPGGIPPADFRALYHHWKAKSMPIPQQEPFPNAYGHGSVTNQCAHIVFVRDSLVTKAHKAREGAGMVEYEGRVIVEKVAGSSQEVVKRDSITTYEMKTPTSLTD